MSGALDCIDVILKYHDLGMRIFDIEYILTSVFNMYIDDEKNKIIIKKEGKKKWVYRFFNIRVINVNLSKCPQ